MTFAININNDKAFRISAQNIQFFIFAYTTIFLGFFVVYLSF